MHAVVLGHVVHCLMPTFEGASQGFLRMAAVTAPLGAEALKTWLEYDQRHCRDRAGQQSTTCGNLRATPRCNPREV